ncbi:MAG: HIT family protein [Chitinophagales bacterium]|nr:HIT family protein [Hyphomicrobiales bacterium]
MTNTAYDDSNVFAKILRGEMPVYKVYEDEKTLAFMDIMPRVDGHVLVIPKAPSRNILDVAPDDLAHVIAVTQKIARAAKQAFQADGVALHQFSEAAGGQVVFHLHFHVLPIKEGVAMRPAGVMGDQTLIAQHAKILRAALENS